MIHLNFSLLQPKEILVIVCFILANKKNLQLIGEKRVVGVGNIG